ncbi:MAG: NAD-binding protein, partial [Desulfurivibrionaceae bacterium]
MRRLLYIGILFLAILGLGIFGYMFIDGAGFFDAFYMTVITITTVGYSETFPLSTGGKLFTVFLILIGVGFVLYVFSKMTGDVIEGRLQKTIGRMKMKNRVARLRDHYIVCGYGRIGKVICRILEENNRSLVVIEKDPDKIEAIVKAGYLVLEGEAAADQTLKEAGIEKA